jgi:anaerobic dimethyl sulfoxide reductase subunit B (iron-sulfur subunit)
MAQWGFFYDQSRCIGCKACEFACKNWNDGKRGDRDINPVDYEYRWPEKESNIEKDLFVDANGYTNFKEYRKYYMKERWRRLTTHPYGYVTTNMKGTYVPNYDVLNLSVACNHCEKPACMASCPTGAYYKEEKYGIVLVNRELCISCGKCQSACPWGAPQYYDNPEKYSVSDLNRPRATKCTFCYERIEKGLRPACVAGCMARALDAGPIEELKSAHPEWTDKLNEFVIPDEGIGSDTKPNIIFKKRVHKTNRV